MHIKSLKPLSAKLKRVFSTILGLNERLDEIQIGQGTILSSINESRRSTTLQDFEFKVFSQWGDDGIIQHLSKIVDIKNKTFIEFGVEGFVEANCRFLLMKDNWSGFVIDGSAHNIEKLKGSYFYWKYQIDAICAFITRENINGLLTQSGFSDDLGVLSIDLDGNDYYVLEAINAYRPRILICEYNAVFGDTRKITIPYASTFDRATAHYSHLYYGASLAAITFLADKKGYSLVGTNSAGNNAFYVRSDLLTDELKVLSPEDAYSPSKFRECRDRKKNLTYMGGNGRLDLIKGLPVRNVETNSDEVL